MRSLMVGLLVSSLALAVAMVAGGWTIVGSTKGGTRGGEGRSRVGSNFNTLICGKIRERESR